MSGAFICMFWFVSVKYSSAGKKSCKIPFHLPSYMVECSFRNQAPDFSALCFPGVAVAGAGGSRGGGRCAPCRRRGWRGAAASGLEGAEEHGRQQRRGQGA